MIITLKTFCIKHFISYSSVFLLFDNWYFNFKKKKSKCNPCSDRTLVTASPYVLRDKLAKIQMKILYTEVG